MDGRELRPKETAVQSRTRTQSTISAYDQAKSPLQRTWGNHWGRYCDLNSGMLPGRYLGHNGKSAWLKTAALGRGLGAQSRTRTQSTISAYAQAESPLQRTWGNHWGRYCDLNSGMLPGRYLGHNGASAWVPEFAASGRKLWCPEPDSNPVCEHWWLSPKVLAQKNVR
jgi:hypothetical protein